MKRSSSMPRIVPPPPPPPPRPAVEEPTHRRLRTIPQVVELCPGVSEYALREWVRRAKSNGLAAAICRPSGNRIYIDLVRFDAWLEGKFGRAGEGEFIEDEED